MKKILSYFLLLFCCFGCFEIEGALDSSSLHQIRFALSSEMPAEVLARSIVDGAGLPEGDAVGIFAYGYAALPADDWSAIAASGKIYENARGTVGSYADGSSPLELDDEKVYIAPKHAFYTYYPYCDSLSFDHPVLINDLMGDLDPDGSQVDWMWGAATGVGSSANPVRLQYEHKMAMLKINVAKTPEVSAELLLDQITVGTSDSQKFQFDISTGVVIRLPEGETSYTTSPLDSLGLRADTIPVPVLDDEAEYATRLAARILVLPESGIDSLSFRVNGETYATPSGWSGFPASTAGTYKTVSILLDVFEIVIQIGLGSADWKDGAETNLAQPKIVIPLGARGWEDHSDETVITSY